MQLVVFDQFLQSKQSKLIFQIIFVLDYFDQKLQIVHLDLIQQMIFANIEPKIEMAKLKGRKRFHTFS